MRKLKHIIHVEQETFAGVIKLKALLQAKNPEKEIIMDDAIRYLLLKFKEVLQ